MLKRLLILILIPALLIFAGRIAAVFEEKAQPEENEIVILSPSLPDNLDPVKNSSFENILPLTGIYEGLVRLNPETMDPEPCLADSWTVSEDGKRWTFHLSPGLFFSDGSPCDAGAVKSSISRAMVHREKNPYAAFVLSPVSSVETTGKYSISFILKYPHAPFLKNLALPFAVPVVSPVALGRHGEDFWKHPSGTGPYMLKKFSPGEIVIQPNPRFRGRHPFAGRIVFRENADPGSRVAHLLEGKADIVFHPGRESLDRLMIAGMKVVSATGLDISYIGFYTDRPPFNNKLLRKAVAGVLDRKRIVASTLGGEGVASSSLTPPPLLGGNNFNLSLYGQEQVRKILADEGYPHGMDVTLITYQEARRYCPPGGVALAGEIKRQLDPCGIRVTVQSRSWNEHKNAIRNKAGDFFLYGWTGDNGDADNFLFTLFSSSQADQGLNASGFKNERVDIFLHTARKVADKKSRDFFYDKVQEIIMDEVPVTAISHSLLRVACSPGVREVRLSGFGLIDLHGLKKIDMPSFPH